MSTFAALRRAGAVLLLLPLASSASVSAQTAPGPTEQPTTCRPHDGTRSRPAHHPWEYAPAIANAPVVQRALQDAYPPLFREDGISGVTRLDILVGTNGTALSSHVRLTSGHPRLDEAAVEVAGQMRFSPARTGPCSRTVWVSVPITFEAG